MANFIANSRTNFFPTVNPLLFELAMGQLNIPFDTIVDDNGNNQYCIFGDDDSGCLPSYGCDYENLISVNFSCEGYDSDIILSISDETLEIKSDDDLIEAIKLDVLNEGVNSIDGLKLTIKDRHCGKEELEFWLKDLICPFLPDETICVLIESGAEKLRYISGSSVAFDNSGKSVTININDIYKLAAEKFNIDVNSIATAEYTNKIDYEAKSSEQSISI